MQAMAKRALIFDMDGTIVDNMAFHTQSWITFFERRGRDIDADEFFRTTAGRQGKEIIRSHMGEHLADEEVAVLNGEKESVYRELYAPHLKAVAGFEDLIADARSQGIALAVGTAAPPANVEFTLDGLNLRRHFDTIVGADHDPAWLRVCRIRQRDRHRLRLLGTVAGRLVRLIKSKKLDSP
jgi:beta-phosphoglucomutase-like phosphatase (HAD superfamily)